LAGGLLFIDLCPHFPYLVYTEKVKKAKKKGFSCFISSKFHTFVAFLGKSAKWFEKVVR
jgi:hypothetical protein